MCSGYVFVPAPSAYPGKRYSCGNRVLEHHLVWWQHTGVVVPSDRVVHHVNGIKSDNRFENLELKEWSQHAKDHKPKEPDKNPVCHWCGATLVRLARDVRTKNTKGQHRFFCSSSHAALAGHYTGTTRSFKHGSVSSYSYHGCRCATCRGAHASRLRAYRKSKGVVV